MNDRVFLFGLLLLSLWTPASAQAASANDVRRAAEWVNRANRAVEEGDFAQAAQGYRQAEGLAPDRWEPIYNQGVLAYRQQRYADARRLLTQVIEKASPDVERRIHFNLGNCDFAEARTLAKSDGTRAEKRLRSAIDHYRDSLRIRPDDDTRANMESAARMIRQLESSQNQTSNKDSSQQKDQKQKDQKQGDKEKRDKQKQGEEKEPQGKQPEQGNQQEPSSDQSEQGKDEPRDGSQEGPPERQRSNPQTESDGNGKKRPDDPTRSTESDGSPNQERSPNRDATADKGPQEDSPSRSQAPKGESSERRADQGASGGKPDEADPTPAGQTPGSEESSDSTGKDQEATGGPQSSSSSDSPSPPMPLAGMTRDEAAKMLQAVRDRDLLRRLQRLQRARGRQVHVEKDW